MMFKKNLTKKRLFYFILVALTFVAIYLLGNRIDSAAVAETVKRTGVWGPIVFILLLGSTFVFAPLSGTSFVLAGYLLFDRDVQLLCYISAVLAGAINFWIAKLWGRRIVTKLVGEKNMDKVDEFTEDHGVKTLIFLRVFQGQFHDFISYAFGLTEMKFLSFFIVTLLAPIPWTAIWYFYLFNHIHNFFEFTIFTHVAIIPFYFITAILYARFRKKKQKAAKL